MRRSGEASAIGDAFALLGGLALIEAPLAPARACPASPLLSLALTWGIVKDVRGSESNCEHDSREM